MLQVDDSIERALTAAIDPWLAHMTWRKDYAAWRERRLHLEDYQQPYLRDIESCAGVALRGGRVLDLGAGMGGLVVALAKAGLAVTAAEYNPAYCQIIALRGKRYGLRLPVANAAGESLPFADCSFSLITAWDTLEHVQDVPATLRELCRLLQPGGRALVTITNRFGFRDPHYHLPLVNWLPRPLAEWYIRREGRSKQANAVQFSDKQSLSEMHYYTYAHFARACQQAGFAAQDVGEARLRAGQTSGGGSLAQRLLPILRRLGLALPAYRLYRFLFQGTHTILLTPSAKDSF